MSDLISTPSQAQSPVSNEAFEALIDLLASDGVDESLSKLPNVVLRDPSGKLDFNKIRSMFATQNESHRVSNGRCVHQNGDSDDEPRSSTVPSRSHSPKPVQRPPSGHRRSSTFGNQPCMPIHVHENPTKVEDVTRAHTPSCQPLSFDELNTALVDAQDEVRTLRRQYDQLRNLVTKRLGTDVRDQTKPIPSTVNTDKVAPEKDDGCAETPPSAVPAEIASLSEDEAKRVLANLACSLSLSLSAIGSMASPSTLSPQQPVNPSRQHDVASIARALKFLGTVDELVWRRSSAPSGPRSLPPSFSEDNVVALVARLELWERAVRRSSRA